MSLQFLEEEHNKLLELNEKYGKWENGLVKRLNNGMMLSIKIFEILNKTPIDWDTVWLVTSIASFTSRDGSIDKFEHTLNMAKKQQIIKDFERKNLGYSITTKDDTYIRFLKITEFITNLNPELQERIATNKHAGHCHWDSIHLSAGLDSPHKLVSGYCTMYSKAIQYPHSWLEINFQDREWVLDFTKNEMMNKEGFYKLHNPQNIVEIDNETLHNDLRLGKSTSFADKDIRMYLFHPNEAREEMQKEISQRKNYKTEEFPWLIHEDNF